MARGRLPSGTVVSTSCLAVSMSVTVPSELTLADAALVSSDFVFRQTMPGSVGLLAELFDLSPLGEGLGRLLDEPALVARSAAGPGVTVYDARGRPWLEMEPRLEDGYVSRRGREWPAAGLRVTRIEGRETSLALPARGRPLH